MKKTILTLLAAAAISSPAWAVTPAERDMNNFDFVAAPNKVQEQERAVEPEPEHEMMKPAHAKAKHAKAKAKHAKAKKDVKHTAHKHHKKMTKAAKPAKPAAAPATSEQPAQ